MVSNNKAFTVTVVNALATVQYKLEKIYNLPKVIYFRNWLYQYYRPSEFDVIEYGKSIYSGTLEQFKVDIIYIYDYDFFVYTDYSEQDSNMFKLTKVNKVISYDDKTFDPNIQCERCNYAFISLIVKIKDRGEFPIILSTKDETYYVVGNKINFQVVDYFLHKQHNVELKPLIMQYELEVIDQDIKYVLLNEKQSIVLGKESYTIETMN
jgi:hypothetical protein